MDEQPQNIFADFIKPAESPPQENPFAEYYPQPTQNEQVAADERMAQLKQQRDRRERTVVWGGRRIAAQDVERVAAANKVSPEAIMRLGTWQGRLEDRLGKTVAGQTLLRAEQGLSDLGVAGTSLLSRAGIAPEHWSKSLHREQQMREQFLSLVEQGGDTEALLGQTGSKIYGGVVRSVSKLAAPGAVGSTAVLSVIGAEGYDNGLTEADQLGLSGVQANSYAGRKAGAEVALTYLFGQAGERLGIRSLEESLTPGAREGVRRIAEKVGLKGWLQKLAGVGSEAAEEVAVDAVHQAIELGEQSGAQYDLKRTLLAGATGAAATAGVKVVHGLQQSLAEHQKFIDDTVQGVTAAENSVRRTVLTGEPPAPGSKAAILAAAEDAGQATGVAGRGARAAKQVFPNLTPAVLDELAGGESLTQRRFYELTGVKKTSKPFRDAFTSTLSLYRQAVGDAVQPDGMKVLNAQPVGKTPPPAPGDHDSLVWGEDGTLKIPDHLPAEARGVVAGARTFYEKIHLNMEGELASQAKRTPPHQRPLATAAAAAIKQVGERVRSAGRSIDGELSPQFDAVAKEASQLKFNRAALEAQEDSTTTVVDGDTTAIESKLSDLMENRTADASPRLKAWVDKYKQYMDKRGAVAEREGVRRYVPESEQPVRRALLDQKSDADLQAEFKSLLPKHQMPQTRDGLLDALQSREFFRNVGDGSVFVRMGTETLRALQNLGQGHPLWKPLSAALAKMNDMELPAVHKDLQTLTLSHDKQAAVEIARVFPRFPTALEFQGKRYDLLETHPFTHAVRGHESFAKRMGVLKVLGAKITEPGDVSPLDKLSNDAKLSGLNPSTVDAYLNALSGHSLNKASTIDVGAEAAENPKVWQSLYNGVLSAKLSLSGVTQIMEPLGNIRAWGGNKRMLQAAWQQMQRRPSQAAADVRRAGAFAKEYADMTFDHTAWLGSTTRVLGNSLIHAGFVPHVWNQQAQMAGLVGKIMADDFKAGRASKWDRDTLVNWLGYSKGEADALYDRTAPDDAYVELAQRFSSRSVAGKITSPSEESRIRGDTWFHYAFPFTRYTLQKARDLHNIVGRLVQDSVAFAGTRDARTARRLGQTTLEAGNYFGGLAAGGAFANVIRNMMFYGIDEGFGLAWDDWRTKPIATTFDSLLSGSLGFILGNAYWASKQDDPIGLLKSSAPVGVFADSMSAIMGWGQYAKLSGTAAAAQWVKNTVPLTRGVGTGLTHAANYDAIGRILLPLGLGHRDLEMDAARVRMFRFLDDHHMGPVSGAVGQIDDDTAAFQQHMYAFALEARKREPLSPERSKIMEGHLMAAVGAQARDKQSIAASIRGRKMIRYFRGNKAVLAEFAKEYPEQFEKLMEHDQVLEAWAKIINPGR